MWLMTEPVRKVLRQSTLVGAFQCQQKRTKIDEDVSSSTEVDCCSEMEPTDDRRRKCELAAQAADRRMGQSRASSQIVQDNPGSPLLFTEVESKTAISNRGSSSPSSPTSQSSSAPTSQSNSTSMQDASFQPIFRNSEEDTGLGTAIGQLNRQPQCGAPLPPLKPERDHVILFKIPLEDGLCPQPFPDCYKDAWDHNHVRMPCSPNSLYPMPSGEKNLENRWSIIETSLLGKIRNSYQLEKAIKSYNFRYADQWDFSGLHSFFSEVADTAETASFFQLTLPAMISLALRLPHLITHPIPLLLQQEHGLLTMSQIQISCLLANAFFCTFPRRNAQKRTSEYGSFPTINFNSLFGGGLRGIDAAQANKLRAVIHYFHRVTSNPPIGTLTFERQVLRQNIPWDKCETTLSKLHVRSKGTIEDAGDGMLQVDFANKFVGGGVLARGCVQEEIRFLICPELIVSRLFTEVLTDNECLIVTGAERYSDYTGYSNTFRWAGNHNDKTQRDSWGRRLTEVVAIDALRYHHYSEQFRPGFIKRELNKAYCGFLSETTCSAHLPAVATGNWGCGAFGGDLHLKALIQLIAAARARRDLVYITFGDQELCNDLSQTHQFLQDSQITIGELWGLILDYRNHLMKNPKTSLTVCDFILQLQGQEQSTITSQSDGKACEQFNEIGYLPTLKAE